MSSPSSPMPLLTCRPRYPTLRLRRSDVVKSIPNQLQEAKKLVDNLLDNSIQCLENEIATFKASTVTNAPHAMLSAPQLKQATSEMKDVENRKLNVVVSGMPEGNDDAKDFVTFINENHDINLPFQKSDFLSFERLGKAGVGNTGRLVRIKVKTQDTRRDLLTLHKWKLSEDIPAIYIRPDLTRAQQEVDKQLRAELQTKGKDNFRIYRGKIVPRDLPIKPKVNSQVVHSNLSNDSNAPQGDKPSSPKG